MAILRKKKLLLVLIYGVLFSFLGCGDLHNFSEGAVKDGESIEVVTSGNFDSVKIAGTSDAKLRVTLLWGAQWVADPLCIYSSDLPELARVGEQGCRNPLSFTPLQVFGAGSSVSIEPGKISRIPVQELFPMEGSLVGDSQFSVAYGSLVVFDDRNSNGILDPIFVDLGRDLETYIDSDVIYGASFVSMDQPDTRIGFREGRFKESGFYPRESCGAPPFGLSKLSSGGFSLEAAITASNKGTLPLQEKAECHEKALGNSLFTIAFQDVEKVREVGCYHEYEGAFTNNIVRYLQPLGDLDLENRIYSCAPISRLPGQEGSLAMELIVATKDDSPCKSIYHYILSGCEDNPSCKDPEWNITVEETPGWPCRIEVAP